MNRLLKILHLFSNFLQLRFAPYHSLGDGGIVRFRAECVQFAKNFLDNKFEGAANRFVLAQMMGKLRDVAFEPGQLLGNIGAIGKKKNFLGHAVVCAICGQAGLLDSFQERGADFLYDFGMERPNFLELAAN